MKFIDEGQEKQHAPDFTLRDIRGKSISLSDFRAKKHVVLVLNRGFL